MQRKENNRTIHILTIAACLVSGCDSLLAQSDLSRWPEFHREDLSKWAAKSGKSVQFLDEMTKTATHDDAKDEEEGYFPYTIENVDTQTLNRRGHILLSIWAAGTGHCMRLYVLKRDGSNFQKVWQSYDNLCTESILGPAKSRAVPDGRVIVRFSEHSPDFERVLKVEITYKWDGTSYINVERKEHPESPITSR